MSGEEPGVTSVWRDVAASLLRLGATSYGGPAIMGIMQAELQERRKWVSKERFLEGLSVANMLPGATATQLDIFLGYARGGWWGGLIGGLCFVAPAFVIMLALTVAYATLGFTPIARGDPSCAGGFPGRRLQADDRWSRARRAEELPPRQAAIQGGGASFQSMTGGG
jgi:Chromate transporter